MVEQPKFLENHANPAAQLGQFLSWERCDIFTKDCQTPTRRALRQIHQFQKGCLSSARCPRQEQKLTGIKGKINIAQSLLPLIMSGAVGQSDIFKLHNHKQIRRFTLSSGPTPISVTPLKVIAEIIVRLKRVLSTKQSQYPQNYHFTQNKHRKGYMS